MQLVRNAQCPCCESRESETIQHTLFECTAFEEELEVFLSRLYSARPLALQLTDEYRCWLVHSASAWLYVRIAKAPYAINAAPRRLLPAL